MNRNDLGDRMKQSYEDRTRYLLPRRTYTIIRVDGKAFHTYTRGAVKPFDFKLMDIMDQTAKFLCEEIQGAQFAYIQSDEISILVTDFDKITTSAWFDGNIQKIVSVSASLATGKFNEFKFRDIPASFDARVFTIPDPIEVSNYLIWRQQDSVRNSISMAARSIYSHKELHSKNTGQMQEMLFRKGINWNNYPDGAKRGRVILYQDTNWIIVEPPSFTQDRTFLEKLIPIHPDFQKITV